MSKIVVEGLADFKKDLKAAGDAFPKELQKANKRAAEIIATETQRVFASMGGSAKKVRVSPLASQTRAQVRVGGGSGVAAEVAMGNLWGSKRYRQFPPPVSGGYALYPSIAAKNKEVVDVYVDAIDDITKRAFPK